MKWLNGSFMLVILLSLTIGLVPGVQGAPPARDCGGALIRINSPQSNSVVGGLVSITGSVLTDPSYGYHHYELKFSSLGLDRWVDLVNRRDTTGVQVNNGFLGTWRTSGLPDGPYALRLLAVDRAGQYCEAFSAPIYVQRNQPPPTASQVATLPPSLPTLAPNQNVFVSPTRTPRGTPNRRTPTATATPTTPAPPPATATLPGPTAKPTGIPTIAINVPTDAPRPTVGVTETPTARSRNVAGASSLIPFDLSSIGGMLADAIGGVTGSFILGIKATASVFLLIGAVVFLRRVL